MASKATTAANGPFAKYVGHKARMRRGGVWVRAVPQDEHSTTTAFGTDFPRGYWTPIGHLAPEHQEKLKTNPGFKFSETPEAGEPVVAPEDMVIGPLHGSGNPRGEPEYEDEGVFMQSAQVGGDEGFEA